MILYLHGFRSSPTSSKASQIGARLQAIGRGADYVCPQLPASPRQAIELALQLTQSSTPDQLTIIGSSLGGYYATWLAERLGCRAVLLNPAVRAPRELEQYVGVTTQFHSDEPFEFKQEYIAEMEALAVGHITRPERYFLVAATGDGLLDWREMVAQFPGAWQKVIQGSDHGLSDFPDYLDEVLAFCGVEVPAGTKAGE
jgi:predicted esterase YcpF (UPF0227 family)